MSSATASAPAHPQWVFRPSLIARALAVFAGSTGDQAIDAIKINSLDQLPNSRQFEMAVARSDSGKFVLLLHDQGDGGQVYVGTTKGLTPLAMRDYVLNDLGQPIGAKGFRVLKGAELFSLEAMTMGDRV